MPSEHSLTLTPSAHGLPDGWTRERFHDELTRAAASLSHPAVPCTSLTVTVTPPEDRRLAEEDGTSLVAFRSDHWCHNSKCGHLDTFPFRAMAMTEVHPAGARGAAIREADIELNARHFRFTDGAPEAGAGERTVPLRAVLLHELGHAVGLEDRCVPEGSHGAHAAVPDLELCKPHEAESIMFAPGLNAAVSPLDVAALCSLHPAQGAGSFSAVPSSPAGNAPEAAALGNALLPAGLAVLLAVVLVRQLRGAGRPVPATARARKSRSRKSAEAQGS